MKKTLVLTGIVMAALLAPSCQKAEAPAAPAAATISEISLFANVEASKTTNDGLNTAWAEGDKLNVFHAEAGSTTYGTNDSFTVADAANGQFSGTLTEALDNAKSYDWYVLYPYNSNVVTPANPTKGYLPLGSSSKSVAQVQAGNDSKAHLAGQYFPLYGKAENVAASATANIALTQVMSVIKVNVTNALEDNLTVSTVSVTAPEDIVGTYYIDFSGDVPSFTGSGENYVSKTATLNVTDGAAIAKNGSAAFYVAVKPFTLAAGQDLTISVNGYKKTITAVSNVNFVSGKINSINFSYDKSEEVVSGEYSASFVGTEWTKAGEAIVSGMTWTLATDAGYFGGSTDNGMQIGSAGKPATTVSLSASTYKGAVNKVVVKTKGAASIEATISVSVNGVAYKCGGSESMSLSNSFTEFAFTPDGSAETGDIVISWSNSSAKAIYVKSILVNKNPAPILNPISNPAIVDAAGANVSVDYTITNPVDGRSVSAVSDQAWVNSFDYSEEGKISFTVDANTGDARQATVTVSYEGAESVSFTVNQAKQSSGSEKTYTLTVSSITYSGNNSYANCAGERVYTATATDSSTMEVTVKFTDVVNASSPNTGKLQFKKSTGCMESVTDLGTINSISAGSLTVTTDGGSFKVKNTTSGVQYSTVTISFTK